MLVTALMDQILSYPNFHKLIYGHYGISKTFSAILYKILNDFIVDYKLRAYH